jgi:hypothetical protein
VPTNGLPNESVTRREVPKTELLKLISESWAKAWKLINTLKTNTNKHDKQQLIKNIDLLKIKMKTLLPEQHNRFTSDTNVSCINSFQKPP